MGRKGRRRGHPDEALVEEAVFRHLGSFTPEGEALLGRPGVKKLECSHVSDVWGGAGTVHAVSLELKSGEEIFAIAKVVQMSKGSSERDLRRRGAYSVEANFYERGCAEQLRCTGASCPSAFFVERSEDDSLLILCMSKLVGIPTHTLSETQADAALRWLAQFHATFWGPRADEVVAEGGLQPQGCFWHLGGREEELLCMPADGWQGRLRLAARGLDARLQADVCQTIVHGDAKAENMLFLGSREGKAHPAKDLAYALLCVEGGVDQEVELALLDRYLAYLAPLLAAQGDAAPERRDFVAAYGLCACDLARWLSGWGWLGFEATMRRRCKDTLDAIDQGTMLASEEEYREAIFAAFPVERAV